MNEDVFVSVSSGDSVPAEVPASVSAHYQALEKNASHCIACGGCETRCPFGVEIVERMQKARALFV